MSMDLLELGNGMMISGPTYMNRSCNMMMNNAVAAGCGFGVGQPLDDARSKLQHPYETVSKSPDGRGMAQASSMGGGFFPFTSAQWKELERQAMVFKYMMHSIPVPYDLLFPFIATTDPSGMVIRRDTHLLKFLKNGDPEPGRCRRTDGKKWRCANGVATDQKYCEKHVHRGRPRSRKHVEAASAVNKIHKKPCLAQAQNQSTISPQVSVSKPISGPPTTGASLSLAAFQLMCGRRPSHANLPAQNHLMNGNLSTTDEQWQQLMQFREHHDQLSLDSYTPLSNLKKPTSVVIDAWTLNSASHDLVSLGLSMGHGSYTNEDVSMSETKQDETHDWLGQSGGPLGEVLRPPLTANGAAACTPSYSCTGAVVASLSDAAARHTSSTPSTFLNQDKLLRQSST